MNIKEKIEKLITEGENAHYHNYKPAIPGTYHFENISGPEYDLWMGNIKIFASNYCQGHPLYEDIMQTFESNKTVYGLKPYKSMMSYLKALLNDNEFLEGFSYLNEEQQEKSKLLFISHSTLDFEYVEPFVNLLEDIGFRSKELLFCSSLSGYRIPTGESIYDYLKAQFNKDLHVVFLLSDSYYDSAACLNEMGATWIKGLSHTAILVPEFNYSQITGAIDASKIWFKMNEKERLNELKDSLVAKFDLDALDNNIWERKRDEYLKDVNLIAESRKYKIRPQKVDLEELIPAENDYYKCITRFINKSDRNAKCKNLEIVMTDTYNNKIYYSIDFSELDEIDIYKEENKRVTFLVHKSKIRGIDKFKVFEWKSAETVSNWTNL